MSGRGEGAPFDPAAPLAAYAAGEITRGELYGELLLGLSDATEAAVRGALDDGASWAEFRAWCDGADGEGFFLFGAHTKTVVPEAARAVVRRWKAAAQPDPAPGCPHCGGATDGVSIHCSWDCHVARARALGAREHLPNGLPVGCIAAGGLLLECEHGDHPSYLCPVEVVGAEHPESAAAGDPPQFPETHALIYTDGCVALTLHECTYYLWHVSRDGALLRGPHYGEWAKPRLSAASVVLAKARAPKPGPSSNR